MAHHEKDYFILKDHRMKIIYHVDDAVILKDHRMRITYKVDFVILKKITECKLPMSF